MATVQPPGQAAPAPEPPTADAAPPPGAAGPPPPGEQPKKHHNIWLWASIALAVAVVGLLVWGLNKQSDLDAANDQAAQAEAKASQQQDNGSAIVAAAKSAYDDLKQQIGATNDDLDQTQNDLDQAQSDADQAQKD